MLDSFFASSATGRPASDPAPPTHITDVLIAERGVKLVRSRTWPLLRPILYSLLRYREAVALADAIGPLDAPAVMACLERLLKLDLVVAGTEHVPRTGAFVAVASHPTGIADGVAVHAALSPLRPDMAIFANRDALRVSPGLADLVIPVEWREAFRSQTKTRETLKETARAFALGRALVIFPAGRIAYFAEGRLNERAWQASAVSLARKFRVPVLPVNVSARNSSLFYLFGNWGFTELRDMTVFYELLNKREKTFGVTFGPLIEREALDGDIAEVTTRLQHHCVEALARDPNARFAGSSSGPPRAAG